MFFARNFKNFASAELDFNQPVTLLVGPNGSGKSNLIEAVELLAFLASGRPLHEVTDLGRGGGLEIRGGLDACAKRGEDRFTLGFEGTVSNEGASTDVCYELTVRVGGSEKTKDAPINGIREAKIFQERLTLKGRRIPLFEVSSTEEDSASADNQVRYDNHAQGGKKPVSAVAADRSALPQYGRFARNDAQLANSLGVIEALITALGKPDVLDPTPRLMRDYEHISETRLARNGFNISPVLHDLCVARRILVKSKAHALKVKIRNVLKKQRVDRILKRIVRLPGESFKDFDFIKTKDDSVLFGFRVEGHDKPVTARVLSDGTLRALAILTALETSARGTRLILEEFDNGVHPSRVHLLAEALFDCAERNGLRALATTHNPATLDALTPEQTQSVLFVVPAENGDGARLLPLPELPGLIEFISAGRLGDLITRRVYERHLVPNYEEERVKRIHRWVETLP